MASPTFANSSVNFTETLRKPKYILELVRDFVNLDGNMECVKGIHVREKKCVIFCKNRDKDDRTSETEERGDKNEK